MRGLLLVLIFSISIFSFGQKSKIDSLRLIFNSSNIPKEKAKTLLRIVKFKQKENFNKSLLVRHEFLNFVQENNLISYKYEAYRYLSYFHLRNGFLDSVKYYDTKQYFVAKQLDSSKVVSTLQNIGAYYFKKSQPDSSLFYLKTAEKIALNNLISKNRKDSINKIHGLLMVKTAIIKSLLSKNNFNKALDLTYENLNLADKYNIHQYDLYNYYYLGMINLELRKYDEALKYYKKEYDLSMKNKRPNQIAFSLIHMGKTYFLSKKDPTLAINYFKKAEKIFNKQGYFTGSQAVRNNMFNVYEFLKKYDDAIVIGEEYILQYRKKKQLDFYLASFYVKLGRVYLLNGNIKKGNNYINKGLDFANNNPNEQSISIYNEAYTFFKEKGEFQKSLKYYEKVNFLKDSLLANEVFLEKLTNAETKYQTERKEKENLQLKADKATQELQLEKENKRKQYFAFALLVSLLTLGVFGFYYQRNKKQKAVIENLQKDLHHRVKNNLTIIDSLIEDIKDDFSDDAFTSKLTDLQNRIDSINEVHLQLYKNTDITNLKLKKYVEKLAKNVQQSFAKENIRIHNTIDDSFTLNVEQSFPIGLIINEFLTNSFKYAFPNTEKGMVNVSMEEKSQNYILSLSDNGKGLPNDFDISKLDSFGMDVMKLLSKQLKGTFSLDGTNGVTLKIEFPKI